MQLNFISLKEVKSPRASIYQDGRLVFNEPAIELMGLNESSTFAVAIDESSTPISTIYLVDGAGVGMTTDKLKVSKSGDLFSCKLRTLFDRYKFEYQTKKISFTITKGEYEGENMFILSLEKTNERKPRAISNVKG